MAHRPQASEVDQHDAWASLRVRDFRNLQISRLCAINAVQMMAVAIGYDIYLRTRDPFSLGMVGLVQFFPAVFLIAHTGYLADRYPRVRITQICQVVMLACVVGLLALAGFAPTHVWPIYIVLFLLGVARAYSTPAASALMPQLVPPEIISNAVTWNGFTFNFSTIAGPSIGGAIMGFTGSSVHVYACSSVLLLGSILWLTNLKPRPGASSSQETAWPALMTGLRFVLKRPIVFGSISLDLFAVLLGGAIALLPIYAADILHVGAQGLGVLRAAPALGAMLMGLVMAHMPPMRRAGAAMLWNVAGFGLATIVFAVSRNFWVSLLALALTGAFDMVSVIVRHSMVQLATPDSMRGRVSAVNNLFIGASNELGEFESGLTAAWFGTIPAVLIGGIGTLVVTALWAWWFPDLRKFKRLTDALEQAQPTEIESEREAKDNIV